MRDQERRARGGLQDVGEGGEEDGGEIGGEAEVGEGDAHCVWRTSGREIKWMRTSVFSTNTRFVMSKKASSCQANERLTRSPTTDANRVGRGYDGRRNRIGHGFGRGQVGGGDGGSRRRGNREWR